MKLFWTGLSALLMSACVTTNVYFPAVAVEKAADKIVADVWPQIEKTQADKPQADKPVVTKPAEKSIAAKKEKK
jgi:heat shock protein HslJ